MLFYDTKQRVVILRWQNKKDHTEKIEIELYYVLNGPNYFAIGATHKRGYYIAVQPIKKDGYFTTFTGFTGMKMFFRPASRFNKKVFHELAEYVYQKKEYKEILQAVLEKNNLNLDDYEMEAL